MKSLLYASLIGTVFCVNLQAQDLNFWSMRPNGTLYDIEAHDGTLYVGGFFDKVGYLTGNAALFHQNDTLPDLDFPYIEGDVNKIIPDGAGGWYIAGEFDQVDAFPGKHLVHIMPDNSINLNFNLNINNTVNDIVLKDSIIYIAGKFTTINSTERKYLASYNILTNQLTSFNPAPNSEVFDIELYNNDLIVGGFFSQISGVAQNRLARINTANSINIPFPPASIGFIYDMEIAGDLLLVGGSFVGGTMSVDLNTNAISAWSPVVSGTFGNTVNAISVKDTVVYIGGNFTKINNIDRKNVAAVSLAGNVLDLNVIPDAEVHEVFINGENLFVGGDFLKMNNLDIPHLTKINVQTSEVLPWRTKPSWAILSVAIQGDTMLVGGEFDIMHYHERDNACAFDIETGQLLDWAPQTNFLGVNHIVADKKRNAVHLTGWDSQELRNLKTVDQVTGDELPGHEFYVNNHINDVDMDTASGTLYIGGEFTQINGQAVQRLAALKTDGQWVNLLDTIDGNIGEIAFSPYNQTIYFSGNFWNVNQQARYQIAAIDTLGLLTTWQPEITSPIFSKTDKIFDILPLENKVFLAGSFDEMNGIAQKNMVAVNPETGDLISYDAGIVANSIYLIRQVGNGLFIAGSKLEQAGGKIVNNVAYIGAESGINLGEIPEFGFGITASIHDAALVDSNLYVGGSFYLLNNKYEGHLASLYFDIDESGAVNSLVIVENTYPKEGGNIGAVTITIVGTGLAPDMKVVLKGDGLDDIYFSGDSSQMLDDKLIKAHFNLRGQPLGIRDVVLETPGNDPVVLENAFEIVEGIYADTWADVIAPPLVLTNKEELFYLSYGNKGNIDAIGVPVWLAVSPNLEVLDFGFEMLEFMDPGDPYYDSIPEYVLIDTLLGKPYEAKVYGFIIPKIDTNSSHTIAFTIKGDNDGDYYLRAWSNEPYYGSPLKYLVGECWDALISGVVGFVPGVGCVYSVLDLELSLIFDPILDPTFATGAYAANYMQLTGEAAVGCALDAATLGVGRIALEMIDLLIKAKSIKDVFQKCFPPVDKPDVPGRFVSSVDPNDKTGLAGAGANGWINTKQRFPYMIRYENDPEATAPAKEVVVRDMLDKTIFDLNTLQLKGYAIADSFYTILPGLSEHLDTIDLRPRRPYLVKVEVTLDKPTGELVWKFLSLEPDTKEPVSNPLGGYLPPNTDSLSGQGAIFFDIALFDTISTGREISNLAAIYFDFNEPIITNNWKLTADDGGITSAVEPLPAEYNDTLVFVEWQGEDKGSGILYYDVKFRKDGGPWAYAAVQTTETSMIFKGEPNSTYEFYSVAFDSAQNKEPEPLIADASVTVKLDVTNISESTAQQIRVYPNPVKDYLHIHGLPKGDARISIVNLAGKKVMQKIINNNSLNISQLKPGAYILEVSTHSVHRQFMLMKE